MTDEIFKRATTIKNNLEGVESDAQRVKRNITLFKKKELPDSEFEWMFDLILNSLEREKDAYLTEFKSL